MGFRPYETALRKRAEEWINKTGNIDILVGIPAYNNEDTISYVVEQAGIGLSKYFPEMKTGIFVSDGGSTDNTRENSESVIIDSKVSKLVDIYRGIPGKGTSFRAIFETAKRLKTKAIIVVDSDLRSITPEWIKVLAEPILKEKTCFLAPLYKRHKYDGTITNMLVYPVTRALYGKRVRQPIGGDFSFSGKLAQLYAEKDVWMSDIAKFGIDIWMTTVAINETNDISQVNLGVKVHNAKDPAQDLVHMFIQVISTMFFLMGEYEDTWINVGKSEEIPSLKGVTTSYDMPEIKVNLKKLNDEFIDGFEQFKSLYKDILSPKSFNGLDKIYEKKKKGNGLYIDAELWSNIVYDSAYTFHNWSRNRRRLINILAPLYFGRTASFVEETETMNWEQAENLIQKQAEIFENKRDYLKNRILQWKDI
jgi:glycosyltransferase involved in cell wall biosynthesis